MRSSPLFVVGLPVVLALLLGFPISASDNPAEYKIHLDWNMRDQGPVEGNIVQEWKFIDATWPHTGLVDRCLNPNARPYGRACAMLLAIDAAKHKFDDKALRISVSCQAHPGGSPRSISGAGAWAVAEYLRTK